MIPNCPLHPSLAAGSAGALFVLGLAGGAHCVGMCGPLSCLGSGDAKAKGLLAWHIGRLLAYAAVGLAFASLGQPLQPLLSWPLLAVLAGLPLLAYAVWGRESVPSFLAGLHAFGARSLGSLPPWGRSAGLGLLTPVLPCGLLYAAAAATLAAPSPLHGSLWMLSFAAGTLPVLVLGQTGFSWIAAKRPHLLLSLRRGAALLAALSLFALAIVA